MTQMTEKKKPLIILTGPTAVGKTAASIGLAKAIGGEIISADSMQVYRHMDIGSAKILPEEMKGVKHYLIDVLNPEEEFNVAVFQKMAKDAMVEIYKRGRIPIVVGGTGFYIQALLYDIDFEKGEENTAYRKKLETYAKEYGAQALHDRLREADPKSADAIHANNEAEREKDSPYRFAYFVLNDVRSRLYERIDRRVDLMVEQGLVDEVTALKTRGCTREMVSMQGLGYKEILDYLDGKNSLEEAVTILKRDTRHFAKRQLTWFRRERDVNWIQKEEFGYDEEKILQAMLAILKEKEITD